MAWIILVGSGFLETVWAVALSASKGFSKLGPSVLFAVALFFSMAGLAYALKTLPVGTAYGVWVGIGAVGTAVYGMLALDEPASIGRVLCLVLIIGGVVGLKVMH
ncbi:MAG: SMR family transporter [Actinomycetia bacterium]|nr:SMR family transporter [Actinomycetes bacterium]